jgi:hypothetical protein
VRRPGKRAIARPLSKIGDFTVSGAAGVSEIESAMSLPGPIKM